MDIKYSRGAREIGKKIKTLVTQPDGLNLVLGTHILEGENQSPQFPSNLHVSPTPHE